MVAERPQVESLPIGWYCLVASDDLRPGQVVSRTFAGDQVVVYRTASGAVSVASAFCPHMGAHFGKGGTVCGEQLRCPFHGFEFDRTGACQHAYGRGTPKAAHLKQWPTIERNGFVMAWHHPEGAAPTFDIPQLEQDGWFAPQTYRFQLDSHPQETSENSVDIGHFRVVHGYDQVEVRERAKAEGPLLTASYAMVRSRGMGSLTVRAEFDVRVHGLGYSQVDVHIPLFDLRYRTFVLATPTHEGKIVLTIGLSQRTLKRSRWLGWLGWLPGVDRLVHWFAMRAYVHDVAQDQDIWNNKAYIAHPRLARGDGPIGLYRGWVRQFYVSSSLKATG